METSIDYVDRDLDMLLPSIKKHDFNSNVFLYNNIIGFIQTRRKEKRKNTK